MKDILLLAGVSFFMAIGAALPVKHEKIAELALAEVQITAKRALPALPEVQLPAVTIQAAKFVPVNLHLPEVVITATRLRKA
ncbi:MAG: hypothetical protein ABIQ93_16740 [Saprospiraceae bacterium]